MFNVATGVIGVIVIAWLYGVFLVSQGVNAGVGYIAFGFLMFSGFLDNNPKPRK